MTYLIVGVDRRTLAPWHKNVLEPNPAAAARTAITHADTDGIDLVVAAVIGPNTTIAATLPTRPARLLHAACPPPAADRPTPLRPGRHPPPLPGRLIAARARPSGPAAPP